MIEKGPDADELRTKLVTALSEMYKGEVPLYGKLVDIVRQVDGSVLAADSKSPASLPIRHELERHGAIRLGTELELRIMRRLFRIFGMYPVGCYDLAVVNFPLYATAFRPTTVESLRKNPFRVFTTLLRQDRLSPEIREMAERILEQRHLFTERLLDIIDRAESTNVMTFQDAEALIADTLKIFKWHSKSVVSMDQYLALKQEHPIVADIACFPSAHINHLTPRTLDINLVQEEMVRQGLPAKDRIEGPPVRRCPILLRQTSFKALEEQVVFANSNGSSVYGTHTARFGEVEQRGAAVTPKGRELYDQLLDLARHEAAVVVDGTQPRDFDTLLSEKFVKHYPDSWLELREQGLVYFRYQLASAIGEVSDVSELDSQSITLTHLLSLGLVEYEPITYEDFLPFSAAGIFRSNVGDDTAGASGSEDPEDGMVKGSRSTYREEFEDALGCKVFDEFGLYAALEWESIKGCERELNLKEIIIS
ncbi:Fc.00g032890.m01.CDS01 [Cosmosporella sp. VM-42]